MKMIMAQPQQLNQKFNEIKEKQKQLRDVLKALKSKEIECLQQIHSIMEDKNTDQYDTGEHIIYKKNVEVCSWKEKNLKQFLDAEAIGKYKEEYTEKKTKYGVKRRKKTVQD